MTRNELKSIVKECLLEIIIEGSPKTVVENVRERNSKPARNPVDPQMSQQKNVRKSLDLIHPLGKPATPQLPPRQQAKADPSRYKEIVGNNDVMASIFADTASSGLVESIGHAGQTNSNPIIDTGVDPTLFEGASNWSTLAFAESNKGRSR